MQQRIEEEAVDGDVAFFKALLRYGELISKIVLVNALALQDQRVGRSFRYATEYKLVRAPGIGAWTFELQRLMTGPAKTYFLHEASPVVAEMTQRFTSSSDVWQSQCLEMLGEAERALNIQGASPRTERTAMIAFFTRFSNLRNKYDHGAQLRSQVSDASLHLNEALQLIVDNLSLVRLPWFVTTTTIGGAIRCYPLTDSQITPPASPTPNSVLLSIGDSWHPVNLVSVVGGAEDILFANGQFNPADATFEALSYTTGTHLRISGSDYVNEPMSLASSESEGLSQLNVQGASWGNLPPAKGDYVERSDLEEELFNELVNGEVDPIVTVGGPGGIGKTSTALQVLHKIAEQGTYDLILWFSARDVDLLDAEGAVPVKPKVLSFSDAARTYAHLVAEMGYNIDDPEAAFKDALRGTGDKTLFVFDNFETILEPTSLFNTLKSHLRLPNKLLITTRFTDFKGQYPIDIKGMAFGEFQKLVSTTASRLGITTLLNDSTDYVKSLHRETFGHPYVVKIVLGEIARDGRLPSKVERVLAKRDDILDALFQRSFERLSPAAQRTFLLLCSWRSVVPLVALDAVQRRSGNVDNIDVEAAVQELSVSSMVEVLRPDGKEEPRWVNVPTAAFRFGVGRVRHHSFSSEVVADGQYLHLLGPLKTATIDAETLDLSDFFTQAAKALATGSLPRDQVLDITIHLAGAVPNAWPLAVRALSKVHAHAEARRAISFGPPELEDWTLPDLRLRYEISRALNDPSHVQAALDVLARCVSDRAFGGYSGLLYDIATSLRESNITFTREQKDRVVAEVIQTPRRYESVLDETTSLALAGLAGRMGLRLEQDAWIDQVRHIRDKRSTSRGGVRYSTQGDFSLS